MSDGPKSLRGSGGTARVIQAHSEFLEANGRIPTVRELAEHLCYPESSGITVSIRGMLLQEGLDYIETIPRLRKDRNEIAPAVRRILEKKDKQEVAAELGTYPSTVISWSRGACYPQSKRLKQSILEMDPGEQVPEETPDPSCSLDPDLWLALQTSAREQGKGIKSVVDEAMGLYLEAVKLFEPRKLDEGMF